MADVEERGGRGGGCKVEDCGVDFRSPVWRCRAAGMASGSSHLDRLFAHIHRRRRLQGCIPRCAAWRHRTTLYTTHQHRHRRPECGGQKRRVGRDTAPGALRSIRSPPVPHPAIRYTTPPPRHIPTPLFRSPVPRTPQHSTASSLASAIRLRFIPFLHSFHHALPPTPFSTILGLE